jgi:hypothetical protein
LYNNVASGGVLEIKSMIAMPQLDLSNFFISYLDEADARDLRQSKVNPSEQGNSARAR